MSADNGIIIRQHPTSGKFLVQMYFASADEYPAMDDCRPEMTFNTFNQAMMSAAKMQADYPTEYGITISRPNDGWWANETQ